MEQFLRRHEVERLVGLKHSALYDLISRGKFPKPVSVTGKRAVAWLASEVAAWQAARVTERDMQQ